MAVVYTSVTKSYLPKARVLASSVKKFHPDWKFILMYSDSMVEGFDMAQEPFDEVLTLEAIGIENWKSWSFGHSIVELCTAVKGPAAKMLAEGSGEDKIIYLDPDIKVFNTLAPLEEMLEENEGILTPHMLHPESDLRAIRDNEISVLKHGLYNLGFVGARTSGQGREFIEWWAERLLRFCHDDIPNGLFTDQRWCDLAPIFFDKLKVVRDPGYNVATWNLAHRRLTRSESGEILAGGVPLRFYHFTGYDSGDGLGMLRRYAADQTLATKLWNDYRTDLLASGHGDPKYDGWAYGLFDNGEAITRPMRLVYRTRPDLQNAFPDPYSVVGPNFLNWYRNEAESSRDFALPDRTFGWSGANIEDRILVRNRLPVMVRQTRK